MLNLKYPLQLKFKLAVINPQFSLTDAAGKSVAYVKQKAFKLKEDISVFRDESQTELQYKIKADRWLEDAWSVKGAAPSGRPPTNCTTRTVSRTSCCRKTTPGSKRQRLGQSTRRPHR